MTETLAETSTARQMFITLACARFAWISRKILLSSPNKCINLHNDGLWNEDETLLIGFLRCFSPGRDVMQLSVDPQSELHRALYAHRAAHVKVGGGPPPAASSRWYMTRLISHQSTDPPFGLRGRRPSHAPVSFDVAGGVVRLRPQVRRAVFLFGRRAVNRLD